MILAEILEPGHHRVKDFEDGPETKAPLMGFYSLDVFRHPTRIARFVQVLSNETAVYYMRLIDENGSHAWLFSPRPAATVPDQAAPKESGFKLKK